MKRLSKDQMIENHLVLLAVLEDVGESVNLDIFANDKALKKGPHSCGAVYCIGGWVAVTPHFQKQGVYATSYSGEPRINDYNYSRYVARYLFGDEALFIGRRKYNISQEQEARNRVEASLARLLEE